MMREILFSLADFDLFDQDISPSDYDFFKKHTGAFKRMLQDQSKEKKREFVDKFKTFALTNGCMKGCPSKNDNRHYLDEAVTQYNESFVNGRFSSAKSIVMDAVILAQNRHNLQYMGANSYSKDPFFHKETRDTFRRLFGQPSEKGTCLKVVCVLPLHIKFGGSICRYLRRWLEADENELATPQLPNVIPFKISADIMPKVSMRTSRQKKEDRKKGKTAEDIKREAEIEEFNYQFRKLLDYHPRNYGFDDEPIFNKPIVTEDKKPSTKKTKLEVDDCLDEIKAMVDSSIKEIPRDEGLSLSEYFGLSQNKSETTEGAEVDTGDSPAGSTSRSLSLEVTDINKKTKKEEQELAAKLPPHLYVKTREFRGPYYPSEDGDDADELDKTPVNYDIYYEELKEMFLLGKPHPNVQFEQLSEQGLSKENVLKLRKCKEFLKETRESAKSDFEDKKQKPLNEDAIPDDVVGEKAKKRHACANCRKVESVPRKFQKCQRCHGKRTRFYCSRKCQEDDWIYKHRDDHNSIEDVT